MLAIFYRLLRQLTGSVDFNVSFRATVSAVERESGGVLPVAKLRLTTSGRPELQGADGRPIQVARQPLALLVYLMLEGPSGQFERSRLTKLFWPSPNEEALSSALNKLRQKVGSDVLPPAVKNAPVVIRREFVSCDASRFEHAVDGHDYQTAIDQYPDRFLEDWRVADSGNFAGWILATRSHLHVSYRDCLQAIAHQHASAGRTRNATECWKRYAKADLFSDSVVATAMKNLLDLGAAVDAIELGKHHRTLVQTHADPSQPSEVSDLLSGSRSERGNVVRTPDSTGVQVVQQLQRPGRSSSLPSEQGVTSAGDLENVGRVPSPRKTILAVVTLSLIATLVVRSVRSGPAYPSEPITTVAVLYFDDATPDGRLNWLSRNLTEDLIDALSTIDGLLVISRNGVRPFSHAPVGPDSIGRALSATILVDGSVDQATPDSVRIIVRLIDPANSVQVERFIVQQPGNASLSLRRKLTDEIEQRLRRRIGTHIQQRAERASTNSNDAWEHLGRARQAREDGSQLFAAGDLQGAAQRLRRADSLLSEAARADPTWSQPLLESARLSLVEAVLLDANPSAVPETDQQNVLETSIRRLDDYLEDHEDGRALALLGELHYALWQFGHPAGSDTLLTAAYRALTRATMLDRTLARGWYILSTVSALLGNEAQSRLAARRALEADIYAGDAPAVLTSLFFLALNSGRSGEADSLCAVGRLHYPSNPNFLECSLTVLGWFGAGHDAIDSAWAIAQHVDTVTTVRQGRLHRRLMVAALIARTAMADSARSVMTATRALADSGAWRQLAVTRAWIHLQLRDIPQALALLASEIETHPEARRWIADHLWFEPLEVNPIFQQLMTRE